MQHLTWTVPLGLAALALLGLAVLHRRRPRAVPDWPAVRPDWADEELAEVMTPSDPLGRELSPAELAPATIFDEIAAAHSIQVDWAPPTWSQEWRIAGERLRELGDTQTMPAIGADASSLVGSL